MQTREALDRNTIEGVTLSLYSPWEGRHSDRSVLIIFSYGQEGGYRSCTYCSNEQTTMHTVLASVFLALLYVAPKVIRAASSTCTRTAARKRYVTTCERLPGSGECVCADDHWRNQTQHHVKRQFTFPPPPPSYPLDGEALTSAVCDLVNAHRRTNSLPSLPYSRTMEYVAVEHARNLARYYRWDAECNPHSWVNDTGTPQRQTWTACCYPRDFFCMSMKGRELSSVWPEDSQYGGLSWENLFYGSPTTPQTAVDGWKESPGHNRLMLEGAARGCGAAGAGLYVVLWLNNADDPLGYGPVPDRLPTPAPTQKPTPRPTPMPTPRPTRPPSEGPLPTAPPGTFASPTCSKLEAECWDQCGRPSVFYFRCRSSFDPFPIWECQVPSNCTSCVIPDSIPTEKPWYGDTAPTHCTPYQCVEPWPPQPQPGWCTNCQANCGGNLQKCIDDSGLCAPWCSETSACWRYLETTATTLPTPRPTHSPTDAPTHPPTNMPTQSPSASPSVVPSSGPTAEPTVVPSTSPLPNTTTTTTTTITTSPVVLEGEISYWKRLGAAALAIAIVGMICGCCAWCLTMRKPTQRAAHRARTVWRTTKEIERRKRELNVHLRSFDVDKDDQDDDESASGPEQAGDIKMRSMPPRDSFDEAAAAVVADAIGDVGTGYLSARDAGLAHDDGGQPELPPSLRATLKEAPVRRHRKSNKQSPFRPPARFLAASNRM